MPVAANKSDSGHMTPERRTYDATVLEGWTCSQTDPILQFLL